MERLFDIIYESDELLVINKPAGLVCHPTKTDEYSSLVSRVRLHVGKDIRPHLINRLDRETSGVTLVAKRDEAARELRRLWESRAVEKEYLAIVHGHVQDESGLIDAPLGKDERSRVAVKDCVRSDGLPSRTAFHVVRRFRQSIRPAVGSFSESGAVSEFTLLRIRLITGRKHQIRIHLSHIGHPIVGDKLYGGDEDLYMALVEDRLTAEQKSRLVLSNQALHAQTIRFIWRATPVAFSAEPDPCFRRLAML